MEQQQYTRYFGKKFHDDGSARAFPGNTVVCKITPDMPIYVGLVDAQERLKALECAGKYTFLPPSSFHMTVMEGLCEHVRTPERWSTKLSLHMPLVEVNQFVRDCFARMSLPHKLTMRIVEGAFSRVLVIVLEPAEMETAQALNSFREQFSRETGIRFPNHATYTYHISLAYNLVPLITSEEHMIQKEQQAIQRALSTTYTNIEIGIPRLTYFENMFRFDDAKLVDAIRAECM